MDEFKMLGIEDLGKYLVQEGISSKTIEKLASEMISGRSLTLLDEAELKEVIPIIGDRAVVRNILKSLHDSETNKLLQPKVISMDEISQMVNSVDHSILSEILSSPARDKTDIDEDDSIEMHEETHDNDENDSNEIHDFDNYSFDQTMPNHFFTSPSAGKSTSSTSTSSTFDYHTSTPVTPASKPNLPIRKSQRPQEPHLKRPFKIPSEFPASVKSGLQKKQLFGRSRTKFITTVAQAIYREKCYPTRDELEHVVQQVFKEWPFLENNGMRSYVTTLQVRMSYLRKPEGHKRGDPTKKLVQPGSSIKPHLSSKPHLPTQPDQPQQSVGEDAMSMKRHYKKLQTEQKKTNPNKAIVQDLMGRTFAIRRSEIVSTESIIPLAEVLDKYPSLRSPAEVLQEFDRIFQKDVTQFSLNKWSSLVTNIQRLDQEQHMKKAKEILGCTDNISEDFQHVIAIVMLLLLLPDGVPSLTSVK